MSTTTTKRPHAQAIADAKALRDMFFGCYQRWEFGGSVRRGKPEVGDVEHIVVPTFADVDSGGGLFALPERKSLLWLRLDALVAERSLAKHLYTINRADGSSSVTPRWGDVYRGVDFRGFCHELWTADAENWGAIFCIRTGPADFSERVVTRIKQGGMYRQVDGYPVVVSTGERVSVPDEAAFLRLAGLPYVEPARRA